MMITSKFALRKQYQAKRADIAQKYRQEAAIEAAKILTQQPVFLEAEHLAFYAAFKTELDVNPMMEAAWLAKKKCYLPVLQDANSKQLIFVLYEYGDPLHKNHFGILEPKQLELCISPRELDAVIVPLVAFDKRGHRLGTGGGFYDYTFACQQQSKATTPHMIGAGFAAQEAKSIPFDAWDIRLQYVVTEKQWIECVEA